jgi:hypothetical protein
MTNLTTNSNQEWEVAGGNKRVTKKVDKTKMPKILNGKDTKVDSIQSDSIKLNSMYDLIRESDDDLDDENNNLNKKKQSAAPQNKVSASPKQVNSAKAKPTQEPLNLLSANMLNSQRKKGTNATASSSIKSPESDLNAALNQLKLDDFEKEFTYLVSLFPNSLLSVNQHLAAFLNQKTNTIPDIEPKLNCSLDSESTYLSSNLEKGVLTFLKANISKLSHQDCEKLFESCFDALFSEKSNSNHGYKIFIQLVVRIAPNLCINNLSKYQEHISNNKHRHQRCLLALWALGQPGYYNLLNGIKIWFHCIMPFIGMKSCTSYAVSYLHGLLEFYKVDAKSITKFSNDGLFSMDQYLRFYDLVNDKSLIPQKDLGQKFKASFQTIRNFFFHDLKRTNHGTVIFEVLLANVCSVEANSAKQTELLEMLSQIVLAPGKDTIVKLQTLYSKYALQTLLFMEYLGNNYKKDLKSIKRISETLHYIEEQTASQINKAFLSQQKETGKQTGYYANRKAKSSTGGEMDTLKKINKLSNQLIKQNFKRTSVFTMVFRTFFMLSLLTGAFFYWDLNSNKSNYTNLLQKELAKYGLLEQTLKLINSVKSVLLDVQKLAYFYIPIWYKMANEQWQKAVPFIKSGWVTTKEYSNLAWFKSEPYRDMVIVYFTNAIVYVQENFPVLVKNLISIVELALDYASTMYSLAIFYISYGLDYIGTQLLGWPKGAMEKIFLDAFKLLLEYLTKLFEWIDSNITKNL